MRKRAVTAVLIILSLVTVTGCAPGDISRYTAKAQQAGEALFWGETMPAAAVSAQDGTDDGGHMQDMEAAEAVEKQEATDEGITDGTGEAGDAAGAAEEMPETDVGSKSAQETESVESTADETPASGKTDVTPVPAMMAEAPRNIQDAFAGKREQFAGNLSGADSQDRTQSDALQAVLGEESYHDRTLCLQNPGKYDGVSYGSYLLLFESAFLTARNKIRGDLWFFNGEKAVKIADDSVFTRIRPITVGKRQYLLTQTEADQAQVYMVSDGQCTPCFEDAFSIEETPDGVCVFYHTEYFQYDPLILEWTGTQDTVPYFYEAGENGFALQPVKKLTAEEYLSYIQPEENDLSAAAFKERQEEKFYTGQDKSSVYSYRFFAIGENRIGYQEQKKGRPSGNADEISHAVAEYSYGIFALDNGKLTADSAGYAGRGYVFENPDEKAQELAELDEIPAAYQHNRIGNAVSSGAAGKKALQAVSDVQEYPPDALAFVSTGDYDGDGKKEAFVAVGSYDGAFGAPVCDLWYVGQAQPQLLVERWPMKESIKYGFGKTSVQLFKGFEIAGVEDQLFSVHNKEAQRCLPDAGRIEPGADHTLMAWRADGGNSAPGYYYLQDGQTLEYALREMETKELLDFDNGFAVYSLLLGSAGGESGISCLRRDNGLVHVTLTAADGTVSYETYKVEKNSLILTDCGAGGYSKGENEG